MKNLEIDYLNKCNAIGTICLNPNCEYDSNDNMLCSNQTGSKQVKTQQGNRVDSELNKLK